MPVFIPKILLLLYNNLFVLVQITFLHIIFLSLNILKVPLCLCVDTILLIIYDFIAYLHIIKIS